MAQNSVLFVEKKGTGQIAVFVLCELNEILRNLKFWQAWNLPTVHVYMLIKLVIVKTKSQQNDWICELTNLHKTQYFITAATETLKLFQNCILQSSLQFRWKKTITKQNTKNPHPEAAIKSIFTQKKMWNTCFNLDRVLAWRKSIKLFI